MIRRYLAGMGPFIGGASAFLVIGVLAVLLEIQSPSFVMWSGLKVQGTTWGGLTRYVYDHEKFTIDNRQASAADQRHVPTTVWLSRSAPDDPSKAYIESTRTRWLDFVFVVGWFVIAAVILAAGFFLRWRQRRRRVVVMGEFGAGISDEFVRRMLEDRRRAVAPRRVTLDE